MELGTLDQTRAEASRLTELVIAYLPNLVAGILILLIGLFLAGWLSRAVASGLARSVRLDPTVRAPIVAIVKYLVVIMTLVIALGQVGVQMTSLLAILGAAGLAIGLALQGTLANIAAGLMLLWLRPFRVGDYVETAAVSGTVREIGLFVSHLETFDGIFVFAPNSTLWNVWLKNHSRASARILAWTVTVPRSVPFDEVRAALREVGAGQASGQDRPLSGLEVFLDQVLPDAQILVVRGAVTDGAISRAQQETAETIARLLERRFGEAGAAREIKRLLPPDGDPSRFMDSASAPEAHPSLVNHRPEAPSQGTSEAPAARAE